MARSVLVPMDASKRAEDALRFALAEFSDADITVLHVTNPLEETYFASEDEFYTEVTVLEGQADDRADGIFEWARDIAARDGRTITTETAMGPPARSIVAVATEHGFDQIVMGSHGRSGISRLLLGSVAEQVARRSPIPVTIVK